MDMTHPTTSTEVRRLIGIVQYYRDLWPQRSHILAPLTEAAAGKTKTSQNKMDRQKIERAFLEMKKNGVKRSAFDISRLEQTVHNPHRRERFSTRCSH